ASSCRSRAVKLASGTGPGEGTRRPNSASKKFWAEAVAAAVSSVVTVTPVTSMDLTPRLKPLWRRMIKAKSPRSRRRIPPAHHLSITFGGGRKYDLSVPGVRCLEPLELVLGPVAVTPLLLPLGARRAADQTDQAAAG